MKKTLSTILLYSFLSQPSHSAIIDNGVTTLDTSNNLLWLDVTETINMSYDEVLAQTSTGGSLEGWRHASITEFELFMDNLSLDFLHRTNCTHQPSVYCSNDPSTPSSQNIQDTIQLLGDTQSYGLNASSSNIAVDPNGAGNTMGYIGGQVSTDFWAGSGSYGVWIANISDAQFIYTSSGGPASDGHDFINSHFSVYDNGVANNIDGKASLYLGHYLVQSVPVPGAIIFYGSALAVIFFWRQK